MKKLMTSTVIIMPLIILAIMLVSGAIMSLTTHIYVEGLEFPSDEAIWLTMDDMAAPPTYDLGSEVTILPLKATNRKLEYSSNDEEIVKVDPETGVLTAVFYGETEVTVKSTENVLITATRRVIVTDDSVHVLKINDGYESQMYEGQTQELSVTIYPAEAKNKIVKWESLDKDILKIGANGIASAVGTGVARVKVTSLDNEEISDTVEITCYPKVRPLDVDRTEVVTSATEATFPEVKINPNDFGIKLTYSSDNQEVATVDQSGKITFKKAGYVVITVRATDFAQNFVEVKKAYTSTYGYYIGPVFAHKNYYVDYDQNLNKNLDIDYIVMPSGAYQDIKDVTYSVQDVLSFDRQTKKFKLVGPMPKGSTFVDVFVRATVYDVDSKGMNENYEDSFRVYITRNATRFSTSYNGLETSEFQTTQQRLTFTESQTPGQSVVNILAYPENHTNDIKLEIIEGNELAHIDGKTLVFNEKGQVKLKISFISTDQGGGNETEHANKEMTISYVPLEKGEKAIRFDEDGTQQTSASVCLNMTSASDKDTGVIYFTTPEGVDGESVKYSVSAGGGLVRLLQPDDQNPNWRIEALKGGFATIQIAVDTAGEQKTWEISVFVNYALSTSDFDIKFNCQDPDEYRTSLDNLTYSGAIDNSNGAMEGKDLYVRVGKDEFKINDPTNFENELTFLTDTMQVVFEVRYQDGLKERFGMDGDQDFGLLSVEYSASTTRGKLDAAPKVTFKDSTLTSGENKIEFSDLNESIELKVEGSFTPADFDISKNQPQISTTATVSASVSLDGRTITLTSTGSTQGREESVQLTIGGQVFTLKIRVVAKANNLTIKCDDQTLNEEDGYLTILDSLPFALTADRNDSKVIDNDKVEYSFDDALYHEATVVDGIAKIDLTGLDEKIYFRSQDQGVKKIINLKKIDLTDFGISLSCQTADGKTQQIAQVPSVKTNKDLAYALPSNITGSVTLEIKIEQKLLGGVGDDDTFAQMFATDMTNATDWTAEHDSNLRQIVISLDSKERAFDKKFTLTYNDIKVNISLSLIELEDIEFVGYNSSNYDHVHPGYQQVRVFAKHSDYGVDGAKNEVDYFKIPFKTKSNATSDTPVSPELLQWTLTRYVGNKAEKVVATQKGRDVTIDGKQFKIVDIGGSNVLQDDQGRTVSGENGKNTTYIWVDPFTESGYARIYFGGFDGLLESDVQNDYFGDFDEKLGQSAGWTYKKPETETQSGRDYSTHDGHSFAFLRVEAGDGAVGGKNCHFNFNVLDDPAGDKLFNVFNATSYYAHSNVVLHENLYGEGELDGDEEKAATATEKELFLTSKENLGKTMVYGNGYQVNLQAYNEYILEDMKNNPSNYKGTKGLNESKGVTLSKAYNAVIRGANPSETLNGYSQAVVLRMDCSYYCELSYYYKFNPTGSTFYAKNTVFSYVPKAGIQLYTEGQSLFVENITMVECGTGILIDDTKHNGQDVKIYYKGFADILNYANKKTLGNLNDLVDAFFGYVAPGVGQYFEWQGRSQTASINGTKMNNFYVNVLTFALSDLGEKAFVWNGNSYTKVSTDGAVLTNGAKVKNKFLTNSMAGTFYALTYEILNDDGARLDNANVDIAMSSFLPGAADSVTGTADFSKFFTKDRYIRLQCEYKQDGVKNYDHILWHKQQVYRDLSAEKFNARESDHIEHLKSTLIGQNLTWPDGTTPEDAVEAQRKAEQAMNINRALSTAVFPSKRDI